MLTIFGKAIESARELNETESKAVIERYRNDQAAGEDGQGTLFLQQQRGAAEIVNSDLDEAEIRSLCDEKKIVWNDSYKGRVKRYVASDESVDSYGDIIMQKGWNLKDRFASNPAIMWAHNYSMPPIGSGIKARVKDGKLFIDVLFMTEDIYPFAETVFKMVHAGFLKGNSVGFIPVKIIDVSDDKEREALGLGKRGVIFEKQILLEDTVCPLGANKNALVQESLFVEAARKGVLNTDDLKKAPENLKEVIENALFVLNNSKTFDMGRKGLEDVAVGKPGYEETENEIRYRVKEPSLFNQDTFKYVPIKKTKPRVNSVMGKLKDKSGADDPMVLQALRFPKEDGWTKASAKEWVDAHEDIAKAVYIVDGEVGTFEQTTGPDYKAIMEEIKAAAARMDQSAAGLKGVQEIVINEIRGLADLIQEAISGEKSLQTGSDNAQLYSGLFKLAESIKNQLK
jgi:hypothetical protein